MQVKTKIRRSFGSASNSYDAAAQLQRNAGFALLEKLQPLEKYELVADLGCGTGFLIQALINQNHLSSSGLIALDIAMPMLKTARKKHLTGCQVSYVCADFENLPLAAQSVDLVLSNLAFQWCSDLGKAFGELKRVLKPGGRVLFTTFGSATLHELKDAWRKVDCYEHVNAFHNETQVAGLLENAGFSQIMLEKTVSVSRYESVWDLMLELKNLGARTVVSGCNKHLTGKTAMQRMMCAYPTQEGSGLVSATFEVLSVSAKA